MIISKYLRLNVIYTDVKPIDLYVPIRKKYVQALRVHIENKSQQWLISLINSSSQKLQRLLITLTKKHLGKVEVRNGKDFVKKSVRIDEDMYDKLRKNRDNRVLSYVVNKAVMKEITSNEIDLIGSKEFDYKITIYFTKEEYAMVGFFIPKRIVHNYGNYIRNERYVVMDEGIPCSIDYRVINKMWTEILFFANDKVRNSLDISSFKIADDNSEFEEEFGILIEELVTNYSPYYQACYSL